MVFPGGKLRRVFFQNEDYVSSILLRGTDNCVYPARIVSGVMDSAGNDTDSDMHQNKTNLDNFGTASGNYPDAWRTKCRNQYSRKNCRYGVWRGNAQNPVGRNGASGE